MMKTHGLNTLIKNQRLLVLLKNLIHTLNKLYIKYKDTEKKEMIEKIHHANTYQKKAGVYSEYEPFTHYVCSK